MSILFTHRESTVESGSKQAIKSTDEKIVKNHGRAYERGFGKFNF